MLCISLIISSLMATVAAFKYGDIPVEYRELIPAEVKVFIIGLSDADKKVLKEVLHSTSDFENEDQLVDAIREKSPDLAERANKLSDMYKTKLAALGPEAQTFAKEMMKNCLKVRLQYFGGKNPSRADLKKIALDLIEKYKALSNDAKEDLKKEFPISAILSNEAMLERLKNMN
ncbi:unnamed protein product [Cylicocyclus nassatus]|uniref:Fatty-acid and retinol-binding protein 1 n=1 Tax=Cylicocyclus nassatus TaxID=53992 RepID=A0AA36GUL7_CYLNA|nr:unnamed protein product [Cylicocyclus nassatus]